MKQFIIALLNTKHSIRLSSWLPKGHLTGLTTILVIGVVFLVQPVLVSALTISPVRFEIEGYPGQILEGEVTLYNEQEITRTFYSVFKNFEARGEGGAPHFLPGDEGFATWFDAPARVVLEPRERATIPFSIEIPLDADPGGHFATIFWSTVSPEILEPGQIVVGAKVGTLVLLSVHGDIPEGEIGILEFNTKDGQRLFNFLPIDLFWRFQNWGGDRIRPTGEITIKNIFGATRAILIANPYEGNILPGSIRKFTNRWGEEKETGEQEGFFEGVRRERRDFALGKYVAHLNLQWGEGTPERKAQAVFSFWIIPWRILLLTFLVLVIVLFLFVVGIKRYNQWIIDRAKMR